MLERYIAKGEDVLTRVKLTVDSQIIVSESMCSDESVLELGMRCIEAYLSSIGMSRHELVQGIRNMYDGKNMSLLHLYPERKISIESEQYDKRNIVTVDCCVDVVRSLLSCLKSCALLATWMPESIDEFFSEYAEEIESLEPEKPGDMDNKA